MAASFYVKDYDGNLVGAQYLYVNGNPILDPNTATAKSMLIYAADGTQLPAQNTNGYLIVPADYSVEKAQLFANSEPDLWQLPLVLINDTQALQLLPEVSRMYQAFKQGGDQDLQRTYNGKSGAAFVSAFTDAASFHLGLVTSFTGLLVQEAEAGGGLYNLKNSIASSLSGNGSLDTSGIWGNNPNNVKSIEAGYNLANKVKVFSPPSLPPLGHGHIASGQKPPVVTTTNETILPGQDWPLTIGTVNVDSNTITKWAFYDATPGNGNLDVNGPYDAYIFNTTTGQLGPAVWGTIPEQQVFLVDAFEKDSNHVGFHGDNSVDTTHHPVLNNIYAAAWDGSQWSNWTHFTITTAPFT